MTIPQTAPAETGAAPTGDLRTWRVLILDNDTGVHADVRKVLEELGVTETESCTSTQEAMSVLSRFPANLIIMEIQIKGATGLNFLRMVRAGHSMIDPHLPIVVISRQLDFDLTQKACEAGIHNFIRKPLFADNLKKRLAATFEKQSLLVAPRKYFGADRRSRGAVGEYNRPERRISANPIPRFKTAQPPRSAKPPQAPAPPPRPKSDGAVLEPRVRPGSKPKGDGIPLADPPAPNRGRKTAERLEPPKPELAAKPGGEIEARKIPEEATPAVKRPERAAYELVDQKSNEKIGSDGDWNDALGESAGDQKGTPEDSGIDIKAILAGHQSWLGTKGGQGDKASLNGAKLGGTDFNGANLASADLRNADMEGALFSGANLLDADLRSANLCGAQMKEAILDNAKLRHAELKGTVLHEAGLKGADLAGADLRGADLTGADFKDANFLSTDIRGATMLGSNLTQKQIDKARGDETTKLPPGIFISK